jgi:3-hydroxyisobutyrate dehydrogenase-like beta-hydroxyacid dehydrogenase
MSSKVRAGIIGMGAMGHQFARHMIAKGFTVTGYDVSAACNEKAAAIGVKVAGSVAEVGKVSDVVIVMVATDAQVEDVIGGEGLLASLAPGSVICVASSTDPNTARTLEHTCLEKGVALLDTPVVLGQEAANNGTCTCFVGGDEAALEKARPVLSCFSANVMHIGASGGGQIAKMINNLLLWSCITANFEALTFARKLGADIPKLIEAMKHSSGANWSLSRWGKSTGKWAEKDMDVALELAQEIRQPMPLAAHVDQLMKTIDQERMKALLK